MLKTVVQSSESKVKNGFSEAPVGRFAPSPTGRMHAGNIFAVLIAWLLVKSHNGSIVLRIEDLDAERSKQHYIDDVMRDFEMLGLTWDKGPYFQHDRFEAYLDAFQKLDEQNLLYPCFCSRADLHAASAPHSGEKYVYQGTCRNLSLKEQERRALLKSPTYRVKVPDTIFGFEDLFQGRYEQNLSKDCGDFIVRRADGTFAYQLAVVVDDAAQGITSVTRGIDLLSSTPQQMYLQEILELPTLKYSHVPLLVDKSGRRLSKRNYDASLEALLSRFKTPEGIIGHLAYLCRIQALDEPISPEELLSSCTSSSTLSVLNNVKEIVWE